MSLTLDTTDNANDTGFTATIAGSSGASVSVWYTPADRPWPGDDWILGGTRTGDGALVVAVPQRFYFVAASVAGYWTPPDRVAVTNGRTAIATTLSAGIAATLATLALPSFDDLKNARTPASPNWVGFRVYDLFTDDTSQMRFPSIAVSLEEQREGEEKGSNDCDDIVYPFNLTLRDTGFSETNQSYRAWVQWHREKIFRAFRNQHLAGVTSSVVTRVETKNIIKTSNRTPGMYEGGFTLRCVNREHRGLGA